LWVNIDADLVGLVVNTLLDTNNFIILGARKSIRMRRRSSGKSVEGEPSSSTGLILHINLSDHIFILPMVSIIMSGFSLDN
jgi:hypothetical protein